MIKYILIICVTVICFSCKKQAVVSLPVNSDNIALTNIDSMLPLAVGNYWIYQKSDDDTMGSLNLLNVFDSVYVEKDTFILGDHYYKLSHTNNAFFYYYFLPNHYGSVFIRDSSNYLVTSDHDMLLDKVNLHDTIFKSVHSVFDYSCIVPDDFTQKQFVIGNFSGISMNCIYIRNIPQHEIVDTVCAQMFVDKIGIVKSVYSFIGCNKHCRFSQNLIRYHCN